MGLLDALQETMGNKVRVNKISDSERGMIFTVYGGMGTGKSTFAYEMAGEERGIWICLERGISAFPNVISLPSTTFAEVKSNVEKVTNKRFLSKLQEDEYPYLIFDGAESMGLMVKKYIADNAGKENLEDIPHGKGWSLWEELFENFVKGIIDSGVTAIFIFHEDEDEEGKKVVAPSVSWTDWTQHGMSQRNHLKRMTGGKSICRPRFAGGSSLCWGMSVAASGRRACPLKVRRTGRGGRGSGCFQTRTGSARLSRGVRSGTCVSDCRPRSRRQSACGG